MLARACIASHKVRLSMGRPTKIICKERTDLTLTPNAKALGRALAVKEGFSLSECVEHLIRKAAAQADLPAPSNGNRGVNDSSAPIRGYLRGTAAAGRYCGVNRKAFREWRESVDIAEDLRALLEPRIIHGWPYFRIAKLDRFMEPANNPPGSETHRPNTGK